MNQAFFQYYKAKNSWDIHRITPGKSSENAKDIFTKSYTKWKQRRNSYKTATKLEKSKAEINLQKVRSHKYLERSQTLDAHMITYFTIINYDNDICNSLTE